MNRQRFQVLPTGGKFANLIAALTLIAIFYFALGVGAESLPVSKVFSTKSPVLLSKAATPIKAKNVHRHSAGALGKTSQPGLAATAPTTAKKNAAASSTSSTKDALIPENRRIVINIPSRTLWLYEGNKIIRYFPVGVGKPGYMTPIGKYQIISKVIDPGWENPYLPKGQVRLAPGESNPLGTRWMGFYQRAGGEYGMHGTDRPASVGKFSSHGCVRMKVSDAEALFDLIDIGTPVEVVYQPVVIRKYANSIRVTVYPDRFSRGMPSLADVKADIIRQFPQATVNNEQLQAALSQANERPTDIGAVPDEDILQAQVEEPAAEPAKTPPPTLKADPASEVPRLPFTNNNKL